jgi:hypothetical protein
MSNTSHKVAINVKVIGGEFDQTYGFLTRKEGWIVKSEGKK